MPPKKQSIKQPAPVEKPSPKRTGVHIDYDFNTSVPNYVYNPALWHPAKGRKPSVDAMLCYMWCIDKVTSVYEDNDGTPTGKVLDGLRIGFAVIANEANLGISYSSVQRNMKYLEDAKLIRRVRGTFKDKYSYEVLNCRKQFNGKQSDGTFRMSGKTYTEKGAQQQAQEEKGIEFLDESKVQSFNIEGDDELA
jgi:hypothetical protein